MTPLIWIAGFVVAGIVLFFPVALATDRPGFCPTCHEMRPYNEQWAAGQHAKTAQCIDCHVDAGLPARFAHKFVALGEVRSHFAGDTSFPRASPASVPNARCIRCHTTLPKTTPEGFSHEVHAAKGTCSTCHAETGHAVTTEVLKAAGVFNASFATTSTAGRFAALDRGVANVEGHKNVVCSRCHDMAKTGCPRCHEPEPAATHKWTGDCAQCHTANADFAFAHPDSKECKKCHKPDEKHFKPVSANLGECGQCHRSPGGSWKFSHPSNPSDCKVCHKAPASHFAGACNQCHNRPGSSWKFSHSSSTTAACASCHKPPSDHFAGQCSQCHHSPGGSWKFSHPSTEEHSWRSKPCAKCHPQSYTVASCTCHGGRTPSDD